MSTLGMMRVPAGDGGAEKAAVPPAASNDEGGGKQRATKTVEDGLDELNAYTAKHGHLNLSAWDEKNGLLVHKLPLPDGPPLPPLPPPRAVATEVEEIAANINKARTHREEEAPASVAGLKSDAKLREYEAPVVHARAPYCPPEETAMELPASKRVRLSIDAPPVTSNDEGEGKQRATAVEAPEPEAAVPESPPTPPPAHHFEQTLLGPVCSKCKTKVAGTGGLFCVTDQTLRLHWRRKKCHASYRPIARVLVGQLNSQLVEIHERIATKDYNSVEAMVSSELPLGTTNHTTSYCSGCGFIGKQCKVKTHVSSDRNGCTERHIKRGTIYKTPSGFRVPEEFLQRIVTGTFRIEEFACEEETYEPIAVNQFSTPSELWELVKTLKARNDELVEEINELREENCALQREGTDSLKRKRGIDLCV